MEELTSLERIKRMYDHKEADHVPITDSPWGSTIERWKKEGMPGNVSYVDYFGLEKIAGVGTWQVDNSPRFPVKILEETEEYITETSRWGGTQRTWKNKGGVPEFLDFTVKDPDSWMKVKEMMKPSKDRIKWSYLEKNYKTWRKEGYWLQAGLWFGFDITHSWVVGTERVLIAMVERPEWIVDMFNHFLDVHLALYDMVWNAGYTFDEISWPDDMGYKLNQFFSLDMYRRLLKPVHKRAVDWAHEKGMKAHLHSCGDIRPLIPELIDIGIDMLNPLEVKAGMDPIELKKKYGDKLAFHGGLNAVLFDDMGKMHEEMKKIIPVMKQNGGYMISSDHSVPESVSLEAFRIFVEMGKEFGKY